MSLVVPMVKLLQAHYAGAVPLDLLKTEQDQIRSQLEAAERRLARKSARLGDLTNRLDLALKYLERVGSAYLDAGPSMRRRSIGRCSSASRVGTRKQLS